MLFGSMHYHFHEEVSWKPDYFNSISFPLVCLNFYLLLESESHDSLTYLANPDWIRSTPTGVRLRIKSPWLAIWIDKLSILELWRDFLLQSKNEAYQLNWNCAIKAPLQKKEMQNIEECIQTKTQKKNKKKREKEGVK